MPNYTVHLFDLLFTYMAFADQHSRNFTDASSVCSSNSVVCGRDDVISESGNVNLCRVADKTV